MGSTAFKSLDKAFSAEENDTNKKERPNFNTLRAKNCYIFKSLDKAFSAEENDTQIIKFGWVILILCPFLEIIFKFRLIFATDERRIVSGKAFYMVFCGSPLIFCCR